MEVLKPLVHLEVKVKVTGSGMAPAALEGHESSARSSCRFTLRNPGTIVQETQVHIAENTISLHYKHKVLNTV
jgi:hypothetical protein